MRSDHRSLKYVVLIGDVANWLEQSTRVLNERNQGAERQHCVTRSVLHHPVATVPNNQGDTDRSNQVNEGEKYRIVKDRVDVRAPVSFVDALKPLQRLLFSVEDLNCLGPRE